MKIALQAPQHPYDVVVPRYLQDVAVVIPVPVCTTFVVQGWRYVFDRQGNYFACKSDAGTASVIVKITGALKGLLVRRLLSYARALRVRDERLGLVVSKRSFSGVSFEHNRERGRNVLRVVLTNTSSSPYDTESFFLGVMGILHGIPPLKAIAPEYTSYGFTRVDKVSDRGAVRYKFQCDSTAIDLVVDSSYVSGSLVVTLADTCSLRAKKVFANVMTEFVFGFTKGERSNVCPGNAVMEDGMRVFRITCFPSSQLYYAEVVMTMLSEVF